MKSLKDTTVYDFQNKKVTVSDVAHTGLITEKIHCPKGKYCLTAKLVPENLIWWGTYPGYQKQRLGFENNFTIEVTQASDFEIGFVCDKDTIADNIYLFEYEITQLSFTSKLNVLLVGDEKGWAFDNIMQQITKYYGSDHNISCTFASDDPDYLKLFPNIVFDVVVKIWYGYDQRDPFLIYPKARRIVCVYDYAMWNRDLRQTDKFNPPYILENLKKAEVILCVSPQIAPLLSHQYPELVANKPLLEISQGVDIQLFVPRPIPLETTKLAVGWIGNQRNPVKRFPIVQATLSDVDWIDFMPQTRTNLLPLHLMPTAYHEMDVIVCFSITEGTPTPILEASACRLTWVSTDVGIVRSIWDCSLEPKAGFIIQDQHQMLQSLRILHENRPLLRQMQQSAYRAVTQFFSWDLKIRNFDVIFDTTQ